MKRSMLYFGLAALVAFLAACSSPELLNPPVYDGHAEFIARAKAGW